MYAWQVWIGALLTLMIFSFLYKDNPIYKFAEHLFVGVSAAYWMVVGVWGTMVPNMVAKIHPPLVRSILPAVAEAEPEYHYLIPCVLGLILLTRLINKIAWLSRWALAFIIGYTAGVRFSRYLQSDFIGQVKSSLIPIVAVGEGGFSIGMTLSHIVLIVGVVCGLIYFFFSKEHKGAFGAASRVGIWILMVTFGASFGYTVMARISLLIGRMSFLGEWLGLIAGWFS
jgi:hypothetical protein